MSLLAIITEVFTVSPWCPNFFDPGDYITFFAFCLNAIAFVIAICGGVYCLAIGKRLNLLLIVALSLAFGGGMLIGAFFKAS